ncbi:MAG TPA: glycosyltransferase [Candidatus Acidoferrales bacterium]|nr:glycosyltransferase [Candidatus Acidoferrales bacterium]
MGHVAAANAVCVALREIDPGARTQVVDSYKYAALVVSRVVSDGYLRMVKTIPQMYRYIYDRAERATEVGPFRAWAHQFTAGNLRPLIQRERPDAIVCTHAFPSGAMAEYKRLYDDAPPVIGVVTDFAVHAFWIHENIDGYCVATEATREVMIARGVRPERVAVTGIPVDPRFARAASPAGAIRERLGLPLDRPIALLMGGGLGIGPLSRTLRAIETLEIPIAAVVIAGRNARVEGRVLAAAENVSYPVRVVRFVDNVYDYMHAADLFVTKPGGLSTAEALAAQKPIVLLKPLPGQEERNVRVLTDWGVAIRARRIDDIPHAIATILTDSGRRERMIDAAGRYGRPNAARDAASIIVRLAAAVKEVPA